MKFLEIPRLSWLTAALQQCEVGETALRARLEAFSFKMAGTDKKLAKTLDRMYVRDGSFPDKCMSPLGNLSEPATRKLLINLISTMNASFPDYDFSHVEPSHFRQETHLNVVMNKVNASLAEFVEDPTLNNSSFLEELWAIADEVIQLEECEIYSYIPDIDGDPFTDRTLWSFNYFFYNKKDKKVLYFTCMARSKLATSENSSSDIDSGVDSESVDSDIDSMEYDQFDLDLDEIMSQT